MARISQIHPHPELSRVQELEMRLKHMEALLSEMQSELDDIRTLVSDEDLERLEKMKVYQASADKLWHSRRSA